MKPTTIIQDRKEIKAKKPIRKGLLICGILSALLYVATVELAAIRWEGYSSTSQTISELIAINAPTRPLVVPLFITYSLLVFAFGLGVWRSADRNRALYFTAVGMVGKEVLGVVVTLFAPIHLRGIEGTLTVFILLAIGSGATANGKRFRLYSIGTILILILFGILTGMAAPRIAAGLPTPGMGIYERINVYGYMLWVMVLAIILLRTEKGQGSMRKAESLK
jgi:hypothetical membrane protein